MINLPTAQELEELQAFRESFCVTMYVPLIDPNTAANPNRIELKNLLKEAEIALAVAGAQPDSIAATLKPARQLLESPEFWPRHREGLVLFMHPKLFRYYHIPGEVESRGLTIQAGFKLGPLLDLIENNQQYYVLALGHKNVCLYEGDRYRLTPVHLKNFPADLKETLRIDEYPESRETHSIAPAGKGSEASHGQYNVAQTDKIMLREFFRRIDHFLHGFLQGQRKPLVIAGVEYLHPIYRKINNYPHLHAGAIAGNQEHTPYTLLHQKAWRILNEG